MNEILLNDFKTQWEFVREDFIQSVDRVGRSGHLILGSEVKEFEFALSKFWGIPHVIGCANGLDAIEIGLRVLGIKPGDKVLTTPLSAFATTLAILRCGGTPVFCDTDESGLLDLNLAEQVLENDSSIKFLVPVHLFGHAINVQKLKKLKARFELKIVEDCAQSIGTKSFNLPTGIVGQMAATSFYPTKNLGCYGDGGSVLTSDPALRDIARSFRDYGQEAKYFHSRLGLNSRLDELQAAFLTSALLPRLDSWLLARGRIAKFYQENLKNPLINIVPIPAGSCSSWHLFPVTVRSRESLKKWLLDQQIQTAVHYPKLIPTQPIFQSVELSSKLVIKTELINAKRFTEEELSLPIHPFLTDSELKRVVDACNSWRGCS
jgi:dTDP-3-amino-3,4,6-trideoxy-alpha-D-glucose transaminase